MPNTDLDDEIQKRWKPDALPPSQQPIEDSLLRTLRQPDEPAQLLSPTREKLVENTSMPSWTAPRIPPPPSGSIQAMPTAPKAQQDKPADLPGSYSIMGPSSAGGAIAATPPPKNNSPLHIIGEIGRGVGSAVGQVVAPWAMPFIPGTIQHQMFETGRERAGERFKTEQEEGQAKIASENARAKFEESEAEKNRRGEMPAETPEQRIAEFDKLYPGDQTDPAYMRDRAEYGLTGKISPERQPAQRQPEIKEEAGGGMVSLSPDKKGNIISTPVMQQAAEGPDLGTPGNLAGQLLPDTGERGMQQVMAPVKEEKPAKPTAAHLTYDEGVPVSVIDEAGKEWDVNDPNLPANLKTLVGSGRNAYETAEGNKMAQMVARTDGFIKARDEGAATSEARKATDLAMSTERNYIRMNDIYNDIKKQGKYEITGPESMALLSSHIAMTFGGVPGVRTGEELIQAHLKARDLPSDLEVLAQKVVSGGVISRTQADQFMDLAQKTRTTNWWGANNTAQQVNQQFGTKLKPPLIPKDLQGKLGQSELVGPESGGGKEPIVQHNPKSGAYRYSTDGGKSWQAGMPPKSQ